jgi:Putative Actinobacterial Holin-X, holin superfamily III
MPDESAPPPEPTHEPRGPDALADALHRVAEALDFLSHLAAAELDRLKLRLRRLAVWAIVAAAGIVVLLAVLVSATGLLLAGIAESVAQLCGGRMWLGALITGGGVLLLGAVALAIGLWSWQKSAFEATREKYSSRKRRERAKFGRSVDPESDPVHRTSSDTADEVR